jgi:hypothetical protein
MKLRQLREELISVQLVIGLINKEHVHEATATTPTTVTNTKWEEDDTWKVKKSRSVKRRTGGNRKHRHQKPSIAGGSPVATTNRYAPLETDSHMSPYDDDGILNIHEELSATVIADLGVKGKNIAQDHYNAKSTPKENKDAGKLAAPNLQIHGLVCQPVIEGNNEIYNIPTVTNGRVSTGTIDRNIQQGILHQGKRNPITINRAEKAEYRKHKILIIGDSHARGLSEEFMDHLDDSYSVLGIVQSNANTAAILSQSYSQVEDLTKEDIIVFLGGTNDISRNEANIGLCALEDFIQQTANTNLILLGAPHRYDLHLKSCVNTEVKIYNRKLQSLAWNSTHAKFIRLRTKRRHHTRHGFHCNKEGKKWIVEEIRQRLRKWNLPSRISAPIELPWILEGTHSVSQLGEAEPKDAAIGIGSAQKECKLSVGCAQVSDSIREPATNEGVVEDGMCELIQDCKGQEKKVNVVIVTQSGMRNNNLEGQIQVVDNKIPDRPEDGGSDPETVSECVSKSETGKEIGGELRQVQGSKDEMRVLGIKDSAIQKVEMDKCNRVSKTWNAAEVNNNNLERLMRVVDNTLSDSPVNGKSDTVFVRKCESKCESKSDNGKGTGGGPGQVERSKDEMRGLCIEDSVTKEAEKDKDSRVSKTSKDVGTIPELAQKPTAQLPNKRKISETSTEIRKEPKPQRKCPKIKNNAFLWI